MVTLMQGAANAADTRAAQGADSAAAAAKALQARFAAQLAILLVATQLVNDLTTAIHKLVPEVSTHHM